MSRKPGHHMPGLRELVIKRLRYKMGTDDEMSYATIARRCQMDRTRVGEIAREEGLDKLRLNQGRTALG